MKVKYKNVYILELLSCADEPKRNIKKALFQVANKIAIKAVAKVKAKVYKDMYRHLNIKVGVNKIFKITKTCNKRQSDISSVHYIENEENRVLLQDEDIKASRVPYFYELFNVARG